MARSAARQAGAKWFFGRRGRVARRGGVGEAMRCVIAWERLWQMRAHVHSTSRSVWSPERRSRSSRITKTGAQHMQDHRPMLLNTLPGAARQAPCPHGVAPRSEAEAQPPPQHRHRGQLPRMRSSKWWPGWRVRGHALRSGEAGLRHWPADATYSGEGVGKTEKAKERERMPHEGNACTHQHQEVAFRGACSSFWMSAVRLSLHPLLSS